MYISIVLIIILNIGYYVMLLSSAVATNVLYLTDNKFNLSLVYVNNATVEAGFV